jgi:hypothetical protein
MTTIISACASYKLLNSNYKLSTYIHKLIEYEILNVLFLCAAPVQHATVGLL